MAAVALSVCPKAKYDFLRYFRPISCRIVPPESSRPSLNPSRSSPALDVFNSVGKGGTQRFDGFDFVFGQPHGTESSSILTEIDHELEKKKLESQSILSEPKVLPHSVRGHTEPRSKARTPFPDSVKQESKTQPDAGQTAKRTLPTRVSSKAGDANIQTHVKGEMSSAKTKGEQVQRSLKAGVGMNTPKPNVTFTEPEITHYTDLVYSGSEDMEPDEQPASNEQEAGDGKMRPGDNLEVLDSISGSENRSRPLSLGEKFPGRSVSSSPSTEDEGIDLAFVYALYTVIATVEGQISVTKGDMMELLDYSNSYWWLVRVIKDGSIGYLPTEIVETAMERFGRLNKHRNIDISV
jgi:hypothetical protein